MAEKYEKKESDTVKLKFKGVKYHSFDKNANEFFAFNGEVKEVSKEKAAQLLSDFPSDWEKV